MTDLSNDIAIVSGLPRSGTSMLMQMIAAAGIPPLTDNQRTQDEDNPRGYYELEAVKALRSPNADRTWLSNAPGRVVKVIHLLLEALPTNHHYRIVFIHRDLDEVLASQAKMLERSGKTGAALQPDRLKTVYQSQLDKTLAAIAARPEMSLLEVHHTDLLTNPDTPARQIADFLQPLRPDHPLDTAAMTAAIDPTLHRNKRT
ncbi:sulfotransferase [Mucisphaera sp.]|uniref:sulfotransferase n=1 Tax=Mucisphaera sp. TaxID=2913024 RepID=UPI003D0F4292